MTTITYTIGLGRFARKPRRRVHVDERQDVLLPGHRLLSVHRTDDGRGLSEIDPIRLRRDPVVRRRRLRLERKRKDLLFQSKLKYFSVRENARPLVLNLLLSCNSLTFYLSCQLGAITARWQYWSRMKSCSF